MENLLAKMMEKLTQVEKSGVYIEDIHVDSLLNFDDENKITLTGTPRPAGEYFVVGLSVLVSTTPQKTISTIDDVFNAAKSAIRQMPKQTENKKGAVIATTDIGTIVRRDPAHKKATKSEYQEDFTPKKNVKKAVK